MERELNLCVCFFAARNGMQKFSFFSWFFFPVIVFLFKKNFLKFFFFGLGFFETRVCRVTVRGGGGNSRTFQGQKDGIFHCKGVFHLRKIWNII